MNSTVSMVGLVVLVLGVLILVGVIKNNAPGQYDKLTQCISDKGGKLYEAYWCSACAQQKEILGNSERLLNKVECSSPGGVNKENPFDLCPEIEATPTWETPDGRKDSGVKTPQQLAELYDCPLE